VSEKIEIVSDWVDSLREDVETLKKVVESAKVDKGARKYAATALNYLITRMDLIPDWTESIGVVDDVLVLRMCIDLASAYNLDEGLSDETKTLVEISRLGNDIERVEQVLGSELFAKMRKYTARMSDDAVRGRTPQKILDDKEARAALYKEIDEELLRMPAATFKDAKAAERQLKNYLGAKLKDV